jgi:alpha-beta hydrolase superfamily lysophospholipase
MPRVGLRSLKLNRDGDRPLAVSVWYPAATDTTRDAEPAPDRCPVVLFSHGLGGSPRDYAPLLEGWAAAGFVVAAPAYPFTSRGAARLDVFDVLNQPADASYVLTELLALDAEPGDPLYGRLDATRVAAAGHSAGGITTLGLFTVARDERLAAGIVLAGGALGIPVPYAGPAVPLLFVHGGRDNVVAYAAGRAAFDAVPWPKAMLSLPRADHGRALQRAGDPAFRVVSTATADFLRWSLCGDQAARRRLSAAAAHGFEDGLRDVARLDDRL